MVAPFITSIVEGFANAIEAGRHKRQVKMRLQWVAASPPKDKQAKIRRFRDGRIRMTKRAVPTARRVWTKGKYHDAPAYRRPGDARKGMERPTFKFEL